MTNIIEVGNKMTTLETKANGVVDTRILGTVSEHLYDGVTAIIDNAMTQVAVYVNAHTSMTFWSVGKYIIDDMDIPLWKRLHLFRSYKNDESGACLLRT